MWCLSLVLQLLPDTAHAQAVQAPSPAIEADALPPAPAALPDRLPPGEDPCFPIERIELADAAPRLFPWLRAEADRAASGAFDPATPRCLGSEGIRIVMARMQDALVRRGFVTTRVLAPPQDLREGVLTLVVVPGRVRAVRMAPGADPRATPGPALPLRPGDLLNLRDIEQGLDNLRRLPSVRAEIDIVPAEAQTGDATAAPGDSDLVVRWAQPQPLRATFAIDDSGTRATGRLQGALTLAFDHPATLNDQLQVSFNQGMEDRGGRQGLRGHLVSYAVPWGFWQLGLSHGAQRHHQQVAGAFQNYVYSGDGETADLRVSRVLHRDADSTTTVSLRGWIRTARNFIDDTEVEVQRRRTAGWDLAGSHRRSLGSAALDLAGAYRRGTGAGGALPAPEEAFGEGSSRVRLSTLDATLLAPIELVGQRLRWTQTARGQWTAQTLVPQDRFAIGGRSTVRGFDGERVLSAAQGWLLREELAVSLGGSGQEVFAGIDQGQVSEHGSQSLAGRRLVGAVLGLRGGFGPFSYEVFAGRPLKQPAGFQAPARVGGFSLALAL